jgi:hypothetical protein
VSAEGVACDEASCVVQMADGAFVTRALRQSNTSANLDLQPLVVLAAQFERQGYFTRDKDSTPDRPVFNRTIGLRDTFAKEVGAKG